MSIASISSPTPDVGEQGLAGDKTHKAMNWQEATHALLSAIGCLDDADAPTNAQDLPKMLRGSGMRAHRVALIHQILPPNENMVGAILETGSGEFLPVLGSFVDAVILSAKGQVVRALEATDLQAVTHAWVVEESVTSLSAAMPFLSRYRGRLIELVVSALIINVFALILPVFSSFVYDKILGNGITDTLWALVIGIGIVIGVEFCVRILRIVSAERFAVGSEIDIDHTTFRNLLDAKTNKMPSIGALLEKYKQVLSFRDFLSSSYLVALADLPFIFLFLITIAVVSGPLVFVAIICGALMLFSSLFFTTPVLDYDREAKVASEQRFGLMADLLTAREAVIGSALRNDLSRHWGRASVGSATASSKARFWRGFGMSIAGSVSFISYIGILVGGVYMVEAHQLTSGGLLAASMLTSRAMANISSIITLIIRYREFRVALRELNQIIPSSARAAQKSCGRLQGAVRVDKVTCRLQPGGSAVLNNTSFAIAPGEIVGIAGAPGAGKTTLLRLISGVLEPDEGRVLIDNIPLEHLSHDDVSLNIGVKPQDFCLLDRSIEENVRAGRAPMSAKDRGEILMASGLGRAFHESGLNWSTEVGPRGSNISGGQRQLVSLARAMLYQPTLLILDEPTNGLDAPLEAHLAQQLANMRGKRTVIVSTHSRNILSICDRIIVIGQSRILADGPRDKILT